MCGTSFCNVAVAVADRGKVLKVDSNKTIGSLTKSEWVKWEISQMTDVEA